MQEGNGDSMLRMIIMLVILAAGMYLILKAKVHFAQRQKTQPDNAWSKEENRWRYMGYVLCAIDVVIAGFINF